MPKGEMRPECPSRNPSSVKPRPWHMCQAVAQNLTTYPIKPVEARNTKDHGSRACGEKPILDTYLLFPEKWPQIWIVSIFCLSFNIMPTRSRPDNYLWYSCCFGLFLLFVWEWFPFSSGTQCIKHHRAVSTWGQADFTKNSPFFLLRGPSLLPWVTNTSLRCWRTRSIKTGN